MDDENIVSLILVGKHFCVRDYANPGKEPYDPMMFKIFYIQLNQWFVQFLRLPISLNVSLSASFFRMVLQYRWSRCPVFWTPAVFACKKRLFFHSRTQLLKKLEKKTLNWLTSIASERPRLFLSSKSPQFEPDRVNV